MSELVNLFSVPIYITKPPLHQFKKIEKEVFNYTTKNNLKRIPKWNSNVKSSWGYSQDNTFNSPTFNKLILEHSVKFAQKLNSPVNNFLIANSWINISLPNVSQEVHSHLDDKLSVIFSGIYYIHKPPNTGETLFVNPLHSEFQHLSKLQAYLGDFYKRLNVEKGALVLFPSWLQHSTEINRSKNKRVTLSFNIIIK